MKIEIPVKNQLDLFNKWLLFINPILKLREETELPVLASLVLLAYTHRSYDKNTLNTLLFAKDTLDAVRSKLGCSERSFHKSLKALAEKGMIVEAEFKDGEIKSGKLDFRVVPEEFKLDITFKVD